jgi:hypothetical protein
VADDSPISDDAQDVLNQVLERFRAPIPDVWPLEVEPLTDAERREWLRKGAGGLGMAPSAERLAAWAAAAVRGKGLVSTVAGFGIELGPLPLETAWALGLAMTAGAATRVEGELRTEDLAQLVPVLGQVYGAVKALQDSVGLGVDADRARARLHEFIVYLRDNPNVLVPVAGLSEVQLRLLRKNIAARRDTLPARDPHPTIAAISDDQMRNALRSVESGLGSAPTAVQLAAYLALGTVGRGISVATANGQVTEIGPLTTDQAWRAALDFGPRVQAFAWDFLTRPEVWAAGRAGGRTPAPRQAPGAAWRIDPGHRARPVHPVAVWRPRARVRPRRRSVPVRCSWTS